MARAIAFGKSRTNLTEGPIFKNLLIFSIPILLGSIVTQLYNIADSVIVGQFVSADALAAVSASGPVMSIINMFMIGLSSGSTVVIAQRVGAGNKEALQKSVGTIAWLVLVCSAFITVAGLIASRPLLTLLGTPENIFNDASYYLVVIYLGTLGNMMYQMGSGALRGMGDSTWPFLFLLLCSVLNVVLDLAAVLIFDLGVLGVAIATALSQLVSGIGIIYRINSGGYGVKLSFKSIRPDKVECGKIVGIGLPASIQNIGNSIASMCVQSSVNYFGTAFIAANSIVNKVDSMINIPVVALSTALCTFVGQNMGLFHGVDRCLVNAMRGAGKSVVPMVTAQFGAFSRIPLAYFLAVRADNCRGIFLALVIASFLRMTAISVYYYCGGWKRAVKKFERRHKEEQAAQG